jgi:ABC-type glutathione transport system ATPase component
VVDPVLSIRNLSVALRRDGKSNVVLDDVSIEVFPGEIVAVLGESGSGKSTLGAAIQGLLPQASEPIVSGSVSLCGTEIVGATPTTLRHARRTFVRSVPQDPISALNPTMPILEQLRECAQVSDGQIKDWLEAVGLPDDVISRGLPHRLSGGQRQRVAIAMAMIAKPKLLVADEPTTAVEFELQRRIVDMIRAAVRRQSASALFITHNLEAAAAVCDRLVVLRDGKIVEAGHLEDVLSRPRHAYTQELIEARSALGRGTLTTATKAKRTLPPTIRMANVGKSFSSKSIFGSPADNVDILRGFDLEIQPGECVALVGPSGSGKSTVVRIAAGLLSFDTGTVERDSHNPPQVVFQDAVASLTPWLSIGEQIGERLRPLKLSTRDRRLRVEEAMDLVGLDQKLSRELPGRLSVGECQRAVLARAVIVPPSLLLCDEPTSSIDASLATAILDLINSLRRRFKMATLFVTHDLVVAQYVADSIAVLGEGRVVSKGESNAIIDGLKRVWFDAAKSSRPTGEITP